MPEDNLWADFRAYQLELAEIARTVRTSSPSTEVVREGDESPYHSMSVSHTVNFDYVAPPDPSIRRRFAAEAMGDTVIERKIVSSNTIYLISQGVGVKYTILALYTTDTMTRHWESKGMRVERWCLDENFDPAKAVTAYVVVVGSKAKFRVIDVSLNKKRANKIATSVHGKVRTYEALPYDREHTRMSFYTYFVFLDVNEPPRYYDTTSKMMHLYESEPVPTTVTRRRRYNGSLPYRLVVVSSSRADASALADTLAGWELSTIEEDFEYNVDYQYHCVKGVWVRK